MILKEEQFQKLYNIAGFSVNKKNKILFCFKLNIFRTYEDFNKFITQVSEIDEFQTFWFCNYSDKLTQDYYEVVLNDW